VRGLAHGRELEDCLMVGGFVLRKRADADGQLDRGSVASLIEAVRARVLLSTIVLHP
jgi:hypothetical protein